ncbi:MAG: hypothetical protein M3419_01345 [Actinomycetota bacterium]|nr:hypothetical protein [Actinomycetota bacterium]
MRSRRGPPGHETTTGTAPPARRLERVRWRDPRLAVGVVLVAGSVVLGARVLATADDTTRVWTLREDLAAGAVLDPSLVEVTDVRFVDDGDLDLYLSASDPLPEGLVLVRDTPAGELLARSGLERAEDRQGVELPLPVLDGALPPDLATGDRVDVWVAPDPGQSEQDSVAEQVLAGAPVLSVERSAGSLAGGSGAVVLVALQDSDATVLPETLTVLGQGSVVLVRVER